MSVSQSVSTHNILIIADYDLRFSRVGLSTMWRLWLNMFHGGLQCRLRGLQTMSGPNSRSTYIFKLVTNITHYVNLQVYYRKYTAIELEDNNTISRLHTAVLQLNIARLKYRPTADNTVSVTNKNTIIHIVIIRHYDILSVSCTQLYTYTQQSKITIHNGQLQ